MFVRVACDVRAYAVVPRSRARQREAPRRVILEAHSVLGRGLYKPEACAELTVTRRGVCVVVEG